MEVIQSLEYSNIAAHIVIAIFKLVIILISLSPCVKLIYLFICFSCKSHVAEYEIVGGDHLGCHFSSVLHSTGLHYRDFIYVSFHNQVLLFLLSPKNA